MKRKRIFDTINSIEKKISDPETSSKILDQIERISRGEKNINGVQTDKSWCLSRFGIHVFILGYLPTDEYSMSCLKILMKSCEEFLKNYDYPPIEPANTNFNEYSKTMTIASSIKTPFQIQKVCVLTYQQQSTPYFAMPIGPFQEIVKRQSYVVSVSMEPNVWLQDFIDKHITCKLQNVNYTEEMIVSAFLNLRDLLFSTMSLTPDQCECIRVALRHLAVLYTNYANYIKQHNNSSINRI